MLVEGEPDAISHSEIQVGMTHNSRAFRKLHESDGIRQFVAIVCGRGVMEHRVGDHAPLARSAPPGQVVATAMVAKRAHKSDTLPTVPAFLIGEPAFMGVLPVTRGEILHDRFQLRVRTRLTCDDSTPPSPWINPTSAGLFICRPAAVPVICRTTSATCAIPPATPEWP